ncbi:hypothetical protein [Halomarina oriensis]|uniref:Uncharacterized protein n=1 Tax=Halomarina oriensis TaxID=671145 RepID=A0A6B0GQI9_9EURY|nr:hypothetical protein [Halomarina oriensis]MWG36940.1 hypothetical protein [Halomarina oriensis]
MTDDITTDYDDVQITTDLPEEWPATRTASLASQTMGLAADLQKALDVGTNPEDLIAQFDEFASGALQQYCSIHRSEDGDGVEIRVSADPEVRTDGGRSLDERRVDALEGIEAQLRYQNAALCELIATVEHVGLATIGVEEPRSGSRSYRALQTALDDHDFTRQEKADDTGIGGFGGEFR